MTYLKSFTKGLSYTGECLIMIVNCIILLIVYIFGVGITSIIAKITGKKFLDTKINKKRKSYWTDLNLEKKEEDYYYKQF